jgi:hypothetical protein
MHLMPDALLLLAARAPAEIPEWFDQHGQVQGLEAPDVPTSPSRDEQERRHEARRQAAIDRYFAWRWFYAQQMLNARSHLGKAGDE